MRKYHRQLCKFAPQQLNTRQLSYGCVWNYHWPHKTLRYAVFCNRLIVSNVAIDVPDGFFLWNAFLFLKHIDKSDRLSISSGSAFIHHINIWVKTINIRLHNASLKSHMKYVFILELRPWMSPSITIYYPTQRIKVKLSHRMPHFKDECHLSGSSLIRM